MYQEAVNCADRQCSLLKNACKRYALIVKTPDSNKTVTQNKENELVSPFFHPAECVYWDILAKSENQKLVLSVDQQTNIDDWKVVTSKAAEEAYRRACPAMTARQMEAFAQGFAKLHGREEANHE